MAIFPNVPLAPGVGTFFERINKLAKCHYVTQKRLFELLSYDPNTGIFRWKVTRAKGKKGAIAGSFDKDGYIRIGIDGICHKAHDLAFIWMLGRLPHPHADHKDLAKANK